MSQLGKLLLRNTFTNYVNLFWRLCSAIILTRVILFGLGREYYGFWVLLWSIFGYSLLLDFGFGQAVQKYTAEAGESGDVDTYNKLISTVFGSYFSMSLIIIATVLGTVMFIEKIFTLPNGDLTYFRMAYVIFGVGIAAVFPTGIFPEILIGLKRIDIKNYILFFNITLELIGICLILKLGGSLLALAIYSAALNLSSNIVMLMAIRKLLPGFKISLCHFKLKHIKVITDFSFFAYIITIANMIIFRTDKIVLGIMLGMGAVAVYQIGTRISEMMEQLTTQFQQNISPIAAAMHSAGDQPGLQAMVMNSTKITTFIAAGAFLIFFIAIRPILYVWLNAGDDTAVEIGRIILLSVFIMVLFKSTANRFLLMTGSHRFVAMLTAIESAANILLSVILVKSIGTVGVALGTMIPNLLLSLFVIFPVTSSRLQIAKGEFIKKIYAPIIIAALPAAAFLYFAVLQIPLQHWNLFYLAALPGGAGIIYLLTGLIFIFSRREKEQLLNLMPFTPIFIRRLLLKEW